jgi:hypothetical protein
VLEKSGSKQTETKARSPVGDSRSFDSIGPKSDVFALVGIIERVRCWSALRLVSQLVVHSFQYAFLVLERS